MAQKDCEACEQRFSTPFKTAKLCPICRILRDIQYLETRPKPAPRKCTTCAKEFWPIRSTYRQCYECTDWMRAGKRREHTCNVCGKHNKPAPGMDATCLGCVQKNRPNRQTYARVLKERMKEALQIE